MLKLTGICLILGVAAVVGLQLKHRLHMHLKQLIGFKEMLLMLSGEMSYARTPLTEAFRNIAARGKEPFGPLLAEVAGRLEQERGKSLYDIWKSAVEHQSKAFYFSEEEFCMLKGLGENFGYLDIQMQLNHMALDIQQVETRIGQAQQELAAKQKMYQYLSIMSGLFLILLLI